MPSRPIIVAAIVLAALTAYFGSGTITPGSAATPAADPAASSGEASSPATSESSAARAFPTPERAVLRLRNTRFGKVIHETNSGLAAYIFTREKTKRSRCYGACAKAWPPVKTERKPRAGSGLKQRDIGVSKRRGGGKMVTYKGRPLYFYEHDTPDLILCHDVREFGGDWFVVKRNGKPA